MCSSSNRVLQRQPLQRHAAPVRVRRAVGWRVWPGWSVLGEVGPGGVRPWCRRGAVGAWGGESMTTLGAAGARAGHAGRGRLVGRTWCQWRLRGLVDDYLGRRVCTRDRRRSAGQGGGARAVLRAPEGVSRRLPWAAPGSTRGARLLDPGGWCQRGARGTPVGGSRIAQGRLCALGCARPGAAGVATFGQVRASRIGPPVFVERTGRRGGRVQACCAGRSGVGLRARISFASRAVQLRLARPPLGSRVRRGGACLGCT